jgi:hypothetical protein
MPTLRRLLGWPFERWALSGLWLGMSVLVGDQLEWWVGQNGWAWAGRCVNHFGEASPCTLPDWMLRLLSPFSLPLVVLILGGAVAIFGLPRLAWALLRRRARPR